MNDGLSTNTSPYKGIIISGFITYVIPIIFSAIFCKVIGVDFYSKTFMNDLTVVLFFGYLVGSCACIIFILCGVTNHSMTLMIKRVVHFIKNAKTSWKLAWLLYKDEVAEQGLVFWIWFVIMGHQFVICIVCGIKCCFIFL